MEYNKMGKGSVEVTITVRPDYPEPWTRGITRSIEVSHIENFWEMRRTAGALSEMVSMTIDAMIDVLMVRAEQEKEEKEAAAAAAAEDSEDSEDKSLTVAGVPDEDEEPSEALA